MNTIHFRELEVWNLSMELARSIYELTMDFPESQRYGLSHQLQKSAVSIPSNIAEGNARTGTRTYAHFISIALGSNAELLTQILLARDLELGVIGAIDERIEVCERVGMMLQRLHQSLMRKIPGESRVPSPESRITTGSSEDAGS